ncbi:MAG TPA: hypothetical protein VKB71_03180 [Rhizomicrobium sp.]|nr:hypothetical protein [Rhizomicrobium sp.]
MNIAVASRSAVRAGTSFYLTMAIVSAVIVFVGFAPSFYLKSVIHAPTPPLTLLTIVHGVVFTAWMGLFITQSALISANNIALHRQLGMMGAMLMGAMLSLGYATALTMGRLGHAPPGAPAPLAFMALPLIGMTAIAVLVAMALLYRQKSAWHKRLMLAALFTMTSPGSARLFIPLGYGAMSTWFSLMISEGLLAIAMLHDWRTEDRVHPAYWVAAGVMAVVHISVAWAFTSPAWLAFARAIT